MKIEQGDQITIFEFDGSKYMCVQHFANSNGRCYKDGKFIRQADYEAAYKKHKGTHFDTAEIAGKVAEGILSKGVTFQSPEEVTEYAAKYGWDAEIDEFGPADISKRSDEEDEEITNGIAAHIIKKLPKKQGNSRPRRSVAFTSSQGETLTEKQVDFLRRLQYSDFWEGLGSEFWVDCLADTIGGQFEDKPMTIGAMVSTLNEKKLILVKTSRVDGRKARSFTFTPKGKEIAKEVGLDEK